MNYTEKSKKFTTLVLVLFQLATVSFAQTAKVSEPRQEKLLNGLKLLVWNESQAEKLTVKLRIHSGSAFDPQNKEGVMAVLADALFPNEAQREFFAEDLGGSLEVVSNFDYIQINATGNSDQFLTIIETLATAVTNPQIDKEVTAKVVAARLAKVRELEKNPSYIADQAIAKRLFGNFPYGRAQMGTSQSLAKIDFADLLFAEQRFLTADNATLVIAGNVKPDTAFRAVRRYFGAWEKADKKVPATFRQPEAPDASEYSIEAANIENDLQRSAIMFAGRDDKDFYVTKVLSEIWRNQFCYSDESKRGKASFEAYLLRGAYIISPSFATNESPQTGRNPCLLMLLKDGKPVFPQFTQNNFEQAKSKVIADFNQQMLAVTNTADLWLDVDTYKLASVKDEMRKVNAVTFADVQRVADNLQKQPFVSVTVKKSGGAKQ